MTVLYIYIVFLRPLGRSRRLSWLPTLPPTSIEGGALLTMTVPKVQLMPSPL